MDELLADFLTEATESLEQVDSALVAFEQRPGDGEILRGIFRLVHTIKGTCGFLGLPRLEALTHAAETVMGKYRDGAKVTGDGVETILKSIDRVKSHLDSLSVSGVEPLGDDLDLINALNDLSNQMIASTKHSDQFEHSPHNPNTEPMDALEAAFLAAPGPDEIVAVRENKKPVNDPVLQPEGMTRDSSVNETAGKVSSVPPAIRVQLAVLEKLMTMVSELVLTRNQMMSISREQEESALNAPLQRLCSVTAELQDGVMKTRMQPISSVWQKMPRLVRDLAKDLGKDINLKMSGEETELDRQILEQIKDPLTHMVRNAADHGLEIGLDREQAGKDKVGTVGLNAFHEGGQIVIEISDDGAGLDVDRLRAKAFEKQLMSEDELNSMSDTQIQQLIFHPGFSTAQEVTSVSGRGVGMDVVKANVEVIGGTIEIASSKGVGTTISLRIPLTLAIVPALIIAVGEERFAMPQQAVRELVRVGKSSHSIERLNGTLVLQLRDNLLPVICLREVLGVRSVETLEAGYVVVIEIGSQCFGMLVDEVFHTEEIVVKPMMGALQGLRHFSGTTILGDGSVIMILDQSGLANSVTQTDLTDLSNTPLNDNHQISEAKELTELIIFATAKGSRHALPLSLVDRLETIQLADLEEADGRHLLQYREALMPVRFLSGVPTQFIGKSAMLVFEDRGCRMGLVVDQILDIAEEELVFDVATKRDGVVGTAIVVGRATEIIDMAFYMEREHPAWLAATETGNDGGKRRLLFVEDSAFFRNMLLPIFSGAGFDVTVCEDGQSACNVAKNSNAFDVIVTDIEMPGMDGFAFAKTVSGYSHVSDTPIIALSSYESADVAAKVAASGMSAFVSKRDRKQLADAIRRALNAHELEAA